MDLSALVQRQSVPAAPAPSASQDAEGAPSSESSPFVVRSDDASFPQLIELSSTVPVLVEFLGAGMEPALASAVAAYEGRLLLAVVDAQENPQLAAAFQLREIPAVAAVIAGRPMNLFLGDLPPDELGKLLEELLQVAAQNGVTGRVPVEGAVPEEAPEIPLPPLHQAAFDAISAGDYAGAVDSYRQALRENPRDDLAVAGLAQASLLGRLDGADAASIRLAGADRPDDLDAQLAVADLDVSGGHLDDAFDRLLDLFGSLDGEGKSTVRARLLEYFEIAGAEDARVVAARARLANLLY